MPNPIKYNTSAETLALKKGNFWIGTGDVGKGPTSSTGFYNGISPSTGGFTIYLNKESGGPSIYTVSNEAQLTALTNSISVSTNLIKNNNGGNFADGTIAPFNGSYGTMPTVVDITNDKPYNGSTSTKAAKFLSDGGMLISTDPSPFTMTVGVTYTFSFWYRQTSSKQFYIGFNNQGGSGDMNGNFQAYSASGYFPNPTQTWQRCSWTFTNVVNKPYFFIYRTSAEAGAECLMTEFTLTEGLMPSGPGLTTSGNCLNWFTTQTDKMIFNRDYPAIVTNGLMLNFDAGFSPSFATIPSNANGTTVTPLYDLSSRGNNGTLANGPTYTSANGGGIVLDGTDDTYSITGMTLGTSAFTLDCWFKYQTHNLYLPSICFAGDYWSGDNQTGWGFGQNAGAGNYNFQMAELGSKLGVSLGSMVDGTIYNFVGTRTISGTQQIIRGYVNGNLVGSATGNTIFNLSTSTYFPGYNPTVLKPKQYSYTGPPPATLYNIKVYDRDLSATEITQNYVAMGNRYFSLQVQYMVVAGGGSGGGYGYPSGGGGAGGLLTGYTTSLSLNTNYTITVGAGGSSNSNGSNSVFNTSNSIGGGRGGNGRSGYGVSGGSGGGGGSNYPADLPSPYLTPAGSGTVGQGNNGGVGKSVYGDTSVNGVPTGAGGGGGAGAVGGTGTITPSIKAGDGGNGLYFSEYSTIGGYPSGWFAGGGGGSTSYSSTATNAVGVGGNGGGGNGSYTQFSSGPSATDGRVNTGGGGGGAGYIENSSANGGSGIVILRIPDVYTATFSSGVTSTVTKSGGYKYYRVTATSTTSETVNFS